MENLHEFDAIKESMNDYVEFKKSLIEYEKRKNFIKNSIKGTHLRFIIKSKKDIWINFTEELRYLPLHHDNLSLIYQ
jgi:hypothetical protein